MRQPIKFLLDHSPRYFYYHLRSRVFHAKAFKENTQIPSLFTLSTGRVGTETLAGLFELAHGYFVYHEPTPKLYRLSRLAYDDSAEPSSKKILTEAFLTTRTDLMDYSRLCGRGYIETSPQVTFLAPVIHDALPNARFLHLVRNPHDVVRSGMRRKWYGGHPNDFARIVPKPDSEDGRNWNSYTLLEKNLWLWAETNRWILDFISSLAPKQGMMVHSEDVFSGNEVTIKKIFDFIGAQAPSRNAIRRLLNKRLNSQQSGEFPVSSKWSDDMNQAFNKIALDVARELGYVSS